MVRRYIFILAYIIIVMFLTFPRSQETGKLPLAQIYRITQEARQQEMEAKARWLEKSFAVVSPDSSDYDAIYYDLNLTITLSPNNLEGTVTGVYRSNVNNLTRVKLNFDSREDILPWQDFWVVGDVASWAHANWNLTVNLDRGYNVGEQFSITVHYSGVPRSSGLQGFDFGNNLYGDPVISTLSEPYAAQTWWPCKDDPADKADSVKIKVTVPPDLIVASNGVLVDDVANDNGTRTFIWKERYPITTYLVSLAVSNYATFSQSWEYAPGQFMPVDYFVYPSQLATAYQAFAPLPNMLDIYSDLFGLYPFVNEKYGQAVFPWGGAMEHQTCTSVGSVSPSWEYIYAHELTHQWFGDLVTCQTWGDIWLNEGFATYGEALYEERKNGYTAGLNYMQSMLSGLNYWGVDPVYRYSIDNPWYIFSSTVYEKGAWVLHMLRHVVGDSLFFEIMKQYPSDPRFRFKTATTEQFGDFCSELYGQNLDWFFQQWIYKPYFPVYQWGYLVNSLGGNPQLYLEIRQVQDQVSPLYDHLYKMPIDIRVNYANGTSETFVVWDSLRTQIFVLDLTAAPLSVNFDPDQFILKSASQISVTDIDIEDIVPARIALYPNYPNPFNSTTNILYSLDTARQISLEVFDVLGRKVRTLVRGRENKGGHLVLWDATDDNGRAVASGVYVYRLIAGSRTLSKRMVLVR